MWAGGSQIVRPRGLIGLPRRSTWDADRAIELAAQAARGNIHPCPVLHGGKMLGIIRGESPWSPYVRFKPTPYRMAYTDYNDLIDEFVRKGKFYQATASKISAASQTANNWYDQWTCNSIPVPATLGGAAATAIAFDDTHASALYTGGDVAPDAKYLLQLNVQVGSNSGCLLFYDRVLDYESCVYTAGVNTPMTNVATAARYVAAGQPGLQMTLGADTVHDATATAFSQLQYTDQDGNPLQAMPTTPAVDVVVSAPATANTFGTRLIAPVIAATVIPFGAFLPLDQTDTGVRLVDNYTTTAANTGTFVLALVYPLAYIPYILNSNVGMAQQLDQLFQISAMERLFDGACLAFLSYRSAAGAASPAQLGAVCGWG